MKKNSLTTAHVMKRGRKRSFPVLGQIQLITDDTTKKLLVPFDLSLLHLSFCDPLADEHRERPLWKGGATSAGDGHVWNGF